MSTPQVLVVGSYPPIPRPSCSATLAAVRESWAEGYDVIVASPRSSAAHLTVKVLGVLAGHRLDRARRASEASRLVLVVEEGMPITEAPWLLQRYSARELVRSMRRFDHVTLVVAGDPPVPPGILHLLCRSADRVVDHPLLGSAPPGVTVGGPTEISLADRARPVLGAVARKVLGSRAGAVKARIARLSSSLTGVARRV